MRSRSVVVILFMGVGSVVAFGMITKFAFESNERLRRVADFKASFLEAFATRGVREVSFRWLPNGRGALLRLVAARERVEGAEFLHADIAEFYVKRFPYGGHYLKLAFVAPSKLGCVESNPYLEKDVQTSQVRSEVAARERRYKLIGRLESALGLRLEALTKEGHSLSVTVSVASPEKADEDVDVLLEKAAKEILRLYRLSRRGRLAIRLLASERPPGADGEIADGPRGEGEDGDQTPTDHEKAPEESPQGPEQPPVLAEGTFDSSGRKIRS